MTAQISRTIENCDESLKTKAELLGTALDDITAMTGALTGYFISAAQHPTDIHKVGLGSVRYLLAVGDLLIGWQLLVQADIAHATLTTIITGNDVKIDSAFYQGKIATTAFLAKNILPRLTTLRGIIESIDDEIMRVSEDAF